MIKIRGKVIEFVKVLHPEHQSTGTGERKSTRDFCYVIYDEHDRKGIGLRSMIIYSKRHLKLQFQCRLL